MNSPDLEKHIAGAEHLTRIFGGWPSFHDAEVVELYMERGQVSAEAGVFDFPTLTVKILLWNLTARVRSDGCLETEGHTLAVLRFTEVEEPRISGFNYQNAIMALQISPQIEGGQCSFQVRFVSAFGIDSEFGCGGIEVLNAIPWNPGQRPPLWLNRERLAKL